MAAQDHILDSLTGAHSAQSSTESFRDLLRKGVLDDRQIDVEVSTRVRLNTRAHACRVRI